MTHEHMSYCMFSKKIRNLLIKSYNWYNCHYFCNNYGKHENVKLKKWKKVETAIFTENIMSIYLVSFYLIIISECGTYSFFIPVPEKYLEKKLSSKNISAIFTFICQEWTFSLKHIKWHIKWHGIQSRIIPIFSLVIWWFVFYSIPNLYFKFLVCWMYCWTIILPIPMSQARRHIHFTT